MNQYSDFAFVYDELMNEVDYDNWVKYIEDIIKSENVEVQNILELACGTGNLTIPLTKKNYDIAAIDISEEMLQVAREKAEKEVIGAFIKAVPDLTWKMIGKPVYDEDTVAFRWQFSGKNSGEWAGSPPTNNLIRFEGVSYIHVKAGKITWQGDYYDSKKLDEELKPVK